ncbi:TPA: (Fe-S)-binding protein [Methanosarcina acetivorans]|uniref:Heterodisulfide reductase, subunit D n=2 Tax=Methanosarcina acetivorans TaxID=2214 RepID=Q8TTB1_METAC|nr:(Fe-S)-binding protein [Methanosarcina acetivorans]AAM03970.1 heterodisulfide reductase, subunit D [Methanosarcina acetivorans C2A]HIH95719.1 (Fe-S)-binding protein [Methanosarcina acetivorans]
MNIVEEHREKCTQCGQCLSVCPRYDDLGLLDLLYGYLEGTSEIEPDSLLSCLTCGLCADACPEALGIKMLISPARQKWVSEHGLTDRQTMADPDAENNLFKKVAEMDEVPDYKDGPGSVVYFPGCAGTYINKNMAQATVALLENAGVDYTVLSGLEYCCGAVSAGAGNPAPILRNGQRNIEEVRKRGAKILLTACPGCFKAFKEIYPKMFGELDFEVLQVSQYLERLLGEGKFSPGAALKHRVFYHDPCHLTRGMGVYREARNVLENIPGTELANKTPENSACCGFGGGVRVNYPSESLSVASDRYEAAGKLGCDVIITNCGGCMQNLLEAGRDEQIKVFDLAEYLCLACGLNIEREDEKMLELVNRAYRFCISGYQEPDLP